MNLIKFYYTMGYLFTEKITNPNLLKEYREKILSLVKEFIKKNQYNSYTKKFCVENLRKTDVELKIFLKNNNVSLNRSEKKYIKDYINLVLQFRRFILKQDADLFPRVVTHLTTTKLKNFIINLSKEHKMSPKIAFIDNSDYETIYKLAVERAIVKENLIFRDEFSNQLLNEDETLYKKIF